MSLREEEKRRRKKITKVVLSVVLVAVLLLAVVIGINYLNESKQAKAIMQLDTNPSVELVLNNHDKVIAEVALNADGEKLLANTSFIGLKADVAAERFAQTATEMDKINDTNLLEDVEKSTKVQVTIIAEIPEDYQELAEKVKTKVNEYFSENGIFAGAVVEVNDDIKAALENMGVNVKDISEMDSKELIGYAKTKAEELNKVAIENREELKEKFNELYDSILKNADTALESAKEALEESNINETLKEELQKLYEEAENKYNELKEQFSNEFNEYLKTVQQNSEETLNRVKAEARELYNQTKEQLDARLEEFKKFTEEEKEEIRNAIKDFQESLSK